MSDKIYQNLGGEVTCCLIEGMGLVIGKLGENTSTPPLLKKPRVVQTVPASKEGPTSLRLGELMGSPEEFILSRTPVFLYKIKDRKILDLYVQSTTNLILSGSGPDLKVVK